MNASRREGHRGRGSPHAVLLCNSSRFAGPRKKKGSSPDRVGGWGEKPGQSRVERLQLLRCLFIRDRVRTDHMGEEKTGT